jgi:hypothetical protein
VHIDLSNNQRSQPAISYHRAGLWGLPKWISGVGLAVCGRLCCATTSLVGCANSHCAGCDGYKGGAKRNYAGLEYDLRTRCLVEVSDSKFSCAGSNSLGNPSATITIPVLCEDGRKGLVTATRDYGGMSGGGRFTLNDGTTGDFIFGTAASKL